MAPPQSQSKKTPSNTPKKHPCLRCLMMHFGSHLVQVSLLHRQWWPCSLASQPHCTNFCVRESGWKIHHHMSCCRFLKVSKTMWMTLYLLSQCLFLQTTGWNNKPRGLKLTFSPCWCIRSRMRHQGATPRRQRHIRRPVFRDLAAHKNIKNLYW